MGERGGWGARLSSLKARTQLSRVRSKEGERGRRVRAVCRPGHTHIFKLFHFLSTPDHPPTLTPPPPPQAFVESCDLCTVQCIGTSITPSSPFPFSILYYIMYIYSGLYCTVCRTKVLGEFFWENIFQKKI